MKIADMYSLKDGREVMESKFAAEFQEITEIINVVGGATSHTNGQEEQAMSGGMLYRPSSLNRAFKKEFGARDWKKERIQCEFPSKYYVNGYTPRRPPLSGFREMDFVKNQVGAEVHFSKNAPTICSVCAVMTIFNRYQKVDCGVEIVPVKRFQKEMPPGTPFFEQFVWDLEQRGVADIDIPVLILGITG
ncbi:MAG: restriction endonuclease [Candidatus Handelsmanbacteria bacterium RIFCSPLOWO2_12_FULL_64_10]|uniref:Restriction endonuclease n=1 Tax=Handelsmanbacteria sp. (strain RIFCSPLOWO2_12_FULL_64_10) TaxID=1817868 RepID=A0A1F6D245_HANXR|nr:MAG: restriction endonuclease [Candidatus Handelsmanbacteria bacterium RIFCSPLOWO2_12_FULL_64_10]